MKVKLLREWDNIQKVLNAIETVNIDSNHKLLVNDIKGLFREPLLRNTSVDFYFLENMKV